MKVIFGAQSLQIHDQDWQTPFLDGQSACTSGEIFIRIQIRLPEKNSISSPISQL